jgi:MtrB/PioB family decaheme-associated outer membrane protein
MNRAKRDRSRWSATRRILSAGLPILLVAAGPPEQDAKRRELMTQESEIELGFLWNRDDSNAFGDYTGLRNQGWYVLGNVDIRHRTPWDAENPTYLRLRGLNLGLDSREILGEWEKPGSWGLFFEYDQIPKYWNEQGRIPFFKSGDSNFVLPAGWVAGQNAAGMPLLTSSLREVDSRYMRQSFGGGASVVLPENIDLSASYDHERKWGRYYTGATMGLTGGNPRAVTLPERVDQTTQTWEGALGWAIETLQLDLQYYGQYYNDHEEKVTWENPYLANAAWSPNAAYPSPANPCFGAPGCGLGQKHQPPDNWFHQIVASGGTNLPWWNTRVTTNAAFGWMLQDESFLPYTVNTSLLAPIGLPRNSLDGQIRTTLLNFQVHSEPTEKADLDLRYRYDDRDNQTPRDVYVYIRNDSENQQSISSDQARRNRPYSFTQHDVDFEAGYEIFDRTELTLLYDWTQTERDLQEAKRVWENGVGAELYSRPVSWFTARTHYRHSWRNHSNYKGVYPQWVGHSPQNLATFDPATDFENHPLLRKYYMAKAQTDEVGALFTLVPHERVAAGINVNWAQDDYYDTDIGLTDRETFSAGLDLSWAATDRLYTHAFYSYNRFVSEQESWSFNAIGGSQIPTATNPARIWEGKDKDYGHTVGTGFHLDLIPERLGLDTQYLFSWIRGTTGVDFGPTLGTDFPYPNERTRIHSTSVRLELQATEQIGMRVGYLFERMTTRDWALDGVEPGALSCSASSCAIVSGQRSPEDTTHLVTWSLVYSFFW